jgi:hypothetical protein
MRRKIIFLLTAAILSAANLSGQQSNPQTARQALLEMLFSKTPGTFVKHLPTAMTTAFAKTGVMGNLQQYSTMMNQLQTQGQSLQTFETGSLMLVAENSKTRDKFEVTMENDTLHGDQDDIEVTFHAYKNGQEQSAPFMPQVTFSMKQEAQVWKLNEVSVTLHLPLADPDFVKAITEKMKPAAGTLAAGTVTATAQNNGNGVVLQPAGVPAYPGGYGSDAMVVAAMRTILAAEITYAKTYPNVGYTCTLSSLDGFGGGEPNERQAMLINSGLASGKRYGFVFTLSECAGNPATGFHLTAAPNGNSLGRKAYCADQSGVVRSSSDGNPAACLASGTPVP